MSIAILPRDEIREALGLESPLGGYYDWIDAVDKEARRRYPRELFDRKSAGALLFFACTGRLLTRRSESTAYEDAERILIAWVGGSIDAEGNTIHRYDADGNVVYPRVCYSPQRAINFAIDLFCHPDGMAAVVARECAEICEVTRELATAHLHAEFARVRRMLEVIAASESERVEEAR